MELVQNNKCFDGEQRIYSFSSETLNGESRFGIFLPPQALDGQKCPAVFFLAGLTCTEETFALKAHAQKMASQLGLILVTPDTSPRGENVAKGDHWDIGQGAGFYINATESPWSAHYQMENHIASELYDLIVRNFAVHTDKTGIMGHSMGGHGALTLAMKYPEKFSSVSAFAPICAPSQCPWGIKAFTNYLGNVQEVWAQHDAVELIQSKGALFSEILIDQGLKDQFYAQLNPALFKAACEKAGQKLTLREHEGYDHGYYFIQSFIDEHLQFHAVQLGA
ncbi:S-formylglutathione hydrolase [Acinetobacter chinensis]|uniref:S-formylglutathione hydrolase n=1 Tax=Acinetobacter chinensis TaxID=2004650 RepID=A0A3B7LSU8_9GAMM|nr:S-formylglutathione hydrolase [Acinetobacter chinensis]AXY55892.1 S-formylglutathione hydrolase [Acinetobacter chinensis]